MPKENLDNVTNSFDPKMRIRLMLTQGREIVSDRLVNQRTELAKGPTEVWKGPINIEFFLESQEDVEGCLTYLQKLRGSLPLDAKKEKKLAKKKLAMLDPEPIKHLYHEAKAKSKTQDELIAFLRDKGFVWLTHQYLQDFKIPVEIDPKVGEKYQFMIRRLKQAKNPLADKYDPQLVFAIKVTGDQTNVVRVYMYSKYLEKIELPWAKKKDPNFKKPEFLVFPVYMEEDERIKYSIEHRKLKNDPKLEPSKLYKRWSKHVKVK